MATGNSATVTTIYQSLAGGLSPSASDLSTYTALMNGGWTAAQVAAAIEVSPLVTNVVNPVIREYQAAFGRVPDQAGLNFWIQAEAKLDPTSAPLTVIQLNALATTFVGSAEFTTRYGSPWTPTTVITGANGSALVTALYSNILGRAPDAAGLSYWLNAGVTVANLLSSFGQSAEFVNLAAPGIVAFENAEATGTPVTSGSLLNLAPPGSTGATLTLTTGVDSLTGTAGSDTFIGVIDGNSSTYTVNAGDNLNGNGGVDTFKVTLANYNTTVDLRSMSVSNISNFLLLDASSSLTNQNVYLGTNTYTGVTISNTEWAYVYGVNEGATGTFTLVPGATNAYGGEMYFNNTNATSVTMNDVVTGAANVTSYIEGYFYHGYNGGSHNGLSAATTINATLTVQNTQIAAGDGEAYAYQYIYAEAVGNSAAVINTTLNFTNQTSDGSYYSTAEQYIYQVGNNVIHSTVNVSNVKDGYVDVYANENSSVVASPFSNTMVINASNWGGTYGDTGISVYGFNSVTVNVTGAVSLNDGFNAYEQYTSTASTQIQTVTINASARFDTTDTYLNDYGSTKVIVTGSGFVNLGDFYASASATLSTATGAVVSSTIDASTNTGGLQVLAHNPINSIKGGSGNDLFGLYDVSTFGSSSKGGLVLDGGAGSNTVGFTSAGFATIVAGAGSDIAKIVNFQTLAIGDALPNGTTYDLSLLTGSSIKNFLADAGVATTGTATVTHLIDGSTVTWQGDLTAGQGDGTLVATLATSSLTPTLNVVFNGDFSDDFNTTSATTTNIEKLTAANVTTLNVQSTGALQSVGTAPIGYKADTATNSLTLTDDQLVTLNISGNQKFKWTAAASETHLATVDASANSGGATLDMHLIATSQALAIKGGSGVDTITVGGGLDTVTGGAGKDVFILRDASVSSASFPVITDASAGDKLQFGTGGSLHTVANATGTLGAALSSVVNDYQTFLNAGTNVAAGTISWFQFGGDTYVEFNSAQDGHFDAGADLVVKLTGAHDLTLSTVVTGANGTLTIV